MEGPRLPYDCAVGAVREAAIGAAIVLGKAGLSPVDVVDDGLVQPRACEDSTCVVDEVDPVAVPVLIATSGSRLAYGPPGGGTC